VLCNNRALTHGSARARILHCNNARASHIFHIVATENQENP